MYKKLTSICLCISVSLFRVLCSFKCSFLLSYLQYYELIKKIKPQTFLFIATTKHDSLFKGLLKASGRLKISKTVKDLDDLDLQHIPNSKDTKNVEIAVMMTTIRMRHFIDIVLVNFLSRYYHSIVSFKNISIQNLNNIG